MKSDSYRKLGTKDNQMINQNNSEAITRRSRKRVRRQRRGMCLIQSKQGDKMCKNQGICPN